MIRDNYCNNCVDNDEQSENCYLYKKIKTIVFITKQKTKC